MSDNVIQYAGLETPRWQTLSREAAALLAIAGALTAASLVVVWIGADEEPYFGPVSRSQMLLQVGGGCVLLFAWLQWLAAAAYLAYRRRLHPTHLVGALGWFAIVAFYLHLSPWGYADDVARSQTPSTHTIATR